MRNIILYIILSLFIFTSCMAKTNNEVKETNQEYISYNSYLFSVSDFLNDLTILIDNNDMKEIFAFILQIDVGEMISTEYEDKRVSIITDDEQQIVDIREKNGFAYILISSFGGDLSHYTYIKSQTANYVLDGEFELKEYDLRNCELLNIQGNTNKGIPNGDFCFYLSYTNNDFAYNIINEHYEDGQYIGYYAPYSEKITIDNKYDYHIRPDIDYDSFIKAY